LKTDDSDANTSDDEKQKSKHPTWYHKLPSTLWNLASKGFHFLGSNNTSIIIIIAVAGGIAVMTSYAIGQPREGDCAPMEGDSDFWATISWTMTSICTSWYLLVPYLRGSKWPVRAWFYFL
jgi:hypothetical protein